MCIDETGEKGQTRKINDDVGWGQFVWLFEDLSDAMLINGQAGVLGCPFR
jgi:hypothetical protein